jgi:hypothetical protein
MFVSWLGASCRAGRGQALNVTLSTDIAPRHSRGALLRARHERCTPVPGDFAGATFCRDVLARLRGKAC